MPTPPLLANSNGSRALEAMGEKAHQVEPEKEKQSTESNNEPTTTSPSINDVGNGPIAEEKAVKEPPMPAMEYPRGIEAVFIMVALVLSITLVSLDQVSSTTPRPSKAIFLPNDYSGLILSIQHSDHRCNRYPKDYRPIPQPRRYLMVRFSLLHDTRRFPIHLGQSVQILSPQD